MRPVAPRRGCLLLSGVPERVPPGWLTKLNISFEIAGHGTTRYYYDGLSAEAQLPSTNHKWPTSGLGCGHNADV